jgi:hypothetical protein
MKAATAFSTSASAGAALDQAFSTLSSRLGATPDLLVMSYTEAFAPDDLARAASLLPASVRVHGSSSCLGAMTDEGYHSNGPVLALLGVSDPEGAFGTASEPLDGGARAAGARAAVRAVEEAQRPGEVPSMIWLGTAPGEEEAILLGIADVVGARVPVYGGSSGDNAIKGAWSQVQRGRALQNGVIVSALFPSGEVSCAFSSGYSPTSSKGRITRAGHRLIIEIDGEPAALVYNRWSAGAIEAYLGGGDILMATTMHPLGRVAATIEGVAQHLLIHPSGVDANHGVTVFADVAEGEEIVLMTGSRESLIGRIRGVADAARAAAPSGFKPTGALVIYCAGCMLAVRDDITRVVDGLREALGGLPFLGSFTFGEQGCFVRGTNRHGNLGISVVLLGA